MPEPGRPLITTAMERALRWAADHHRDQRRKGSDLPYVQHPMAVALILERAGWPEPVVIAGLLHDLVEDTAVTLDQLRGAFGDRIAALVDACSEVKHDAEGRPRPWEVRKREHVEALAAAPIDARAVALADKLHNLASIAYDLDEGVDVWSRFNADRGRQLAYYRSMFERLGVGDARLETIAGQGLELLDRVSKRVATSTPNRAPENREGDH